MSGGLGLLEEVDDELRGETESSDSDWVDEASTDDSELFSGVWSLNETHTQYKITQSPHLLLISNSCALFLLTFTFPNRKKLSGLYRS